MSENGGFRDRQHRLSARFPRSDRQPPKGVWILVAGLTGSVIGTVVAYQSTFVMLAAPLIVTAIAASVLHGRVRLWTLSPAALLVVTYLVVGATGRLAAEVVASGSAIGARITLFQFEEQGAYLVFVIAAASTTVGALSYSIARPNGWLRVDRLVNSEVSGSARIRNIAGVLSTVPLGLEVIGHGTHLLVRPTYLEGDIGDPVLVAAQTLSLPAVAVLGWLYGTSSRPAGKIASMAAIALYATILFALATRAFALLPVMAILGMVAARPAIPGFRVALFAAGVGSLFLLAVPLSLRGLDSHGLIPYLDAMTRGLVTSDPVTLFSNVLASFQLTGRVGFGVPSLPISDLVISLDPRPGQLAGWYDVLPDLRLNVYTPYNALGELANYGWPIVAAFFFCTGAYFSRIDRTMRRLLATGNGMVGLVLFGFAGLFIVTTLEYNLRSSVRILYYMMAVDLATVLLRWLGDKRLTSREPAASPAPRLGQVWPGQRSTTL